MGAPYTKSFDHLGLVAGFCKDIQLADLIDNTLGHAEERKVSFGQLFVAMMLNGLALLVALCICIVNTLKANRLND